MRQVVNVNISSRYSVDFNKPLDISIPLVSGKDNPNCYYSEPPDFTPVEMDGFIGSVAMGGSCNHQQISITPHGNGTHTECFGHLSDDPAITINHCLDRFHFMARLVSLQPQVSSNGDQLVRWEQLVTVLDSEPPEALIIRTLPNDSSKLNKGYSGTNPPYIEATVTSELARMGVQHLLVDLPSVDREDDGGRLEAHRAFWGFPDNPRTHSTITELIYVPDLIADGEYLLNLQIISLESDASPSKPLLYEFMKYSKKY